MKTVSIIDYGMSNLLSISRALEHVGAKIQLVHHAEEILNSDYLVLPGVGAFPDGMNELSKRNLVGSIQEFAKKGKPLLGICLGMQMMLARGFEHKETNGLGLIDGDVLPLPKDMVNFKVPNINWHSISEPNKGQWEKGILGDTKPETNFYFVHSFYARPNDLSNTLATSSFGSLSFAAAVSNENVYGTQFHPEKSGEDGLNLLKHFIQL